MSISYGHLCSMRRIDKLIFGSFIGPFLLNLIVIDFILLLVALLKYFDEIMGKGLSFSVFAELIFYFSVTSSPDAFPLAVLLSSIMTFGNLGEHSELTAVKSAGISLTRALVPIFIFVLFLSGFAYYSNTQLVPKTNLKTYSLLWDMRTKKPALDIREGVFYRGIPNYTIKVNEKVDDERLKDIIIYDHQDKKMNGNKVVILADSGRMYSFQNQRYMVLELFNGIRYEEQMDESFKSKINGGQFHRDSFKSSRMVFDLSSFDMNKTDERLFRRSRLVQTRENLIFGVDSMKRDYLLMQERAFRDVANSFKHHYVKRVNMLPESILNDRIFYDSLRAQRQRAKFSPKDINAEQDSLNKPLEQKLTDSRLLTSSGKPIRQDTAQVQAAAQRTIAQSKPSSPKSIEQKRSIAGNQPIKRISAKDSAENWKRFEAHFNRDRIMSSALVYAQNNTRAARNLLYTRMVSLAALEKEKDKYLVTKNQQMARSFACVIMFLIGAPIGAIIKKGGIGLPVVISIMFFLFFYIMNTAGGKWGSAGVIEPALAIWMSNAVLLPFGLFFLQKARNDARLFETDAYVMWFQKVKKALYKKNRLQTT